MSKIKTLYFDSEDENVFDLLYALIIKKAYAEAVQLLNLYADNSLNFLDFGIINFLDFYKKLYSYNGWRKELILYKLHQKTNLKYFEDCLIEWEWEENNDFGGEWNQDFHKSYLPYLETCFIQECSLDGRLTHLDGIKEAENILIQIKNYKGHYAALYSLKKPFIYRKYKREIKK